MTEEMIIDGIQVSKCRHFKYDGIKKPICRSGGCVAVYRSCLCEDNTDCDYKQLKRLEQENESLYEEKNCLHKIIDRLLENAGYSKDIASAEDFEDVYEDMQRKINELAELEQENKQMKSALEEIKENLVKLKTNDEDDFTYEYSKIEDKINEALK